MFSAATGLTQVPTDALITLLRVVYTQQISLPLTLPELTRHGLQFCAGDVQGALRTLDRTGLTAVLVCVIAERKKQQEREAATRAALTPTEPS